jgi:NAD(P)H-dependent FMN reductase
MNNSVIVTLRSPINSRTDIACKLIIKELGLKDSDIFYADSIEMRPFREFNDLEKNQHKTLSRHFRDKVEVSFVFPVFNWSIPAAIKNFFDWIISVNEEGEVVCPLSSSKVRVVVISSSSNANENYKNIYDYFEILQEKTGFNVVEYTIKRLKN